MYYKNMQPNLMSVQIPSVKYLEFPMPGQVGMGMEGSRTALEEF